MLPLFSNKSHFICISAFLFSTYSFYAILQGRRKGPKQSFFYFAVISEMKILKMLSGPNNSSFFFTFSKNVYFSIECQWVFEHFNMLFSENFHVPLHLHYSRDWEYILVLISDLVEYIHFFFLIQFFPMTIIPFIVAWC